MVEDAGNGDGPREADSPEADSDAAESVARVVAKYYLYVASRSEGFIYPIVTLLLLHRGLSYGEVGLVNGLFFAGTVAGEIPTGYVADRLGRRNSLIVSSAAVTGVMLWFTIAETTAEFSLLYVVWGVGVTFRSGAGDAWLYDTLEERHTTDAYARIKGRASAGFLLTSAVTSLAGGYLYSVDRVVPFYAAAAVTASGVLILLTFPTTSGGEEEQFTASDAISIVRTRFLRPPLRSFIVVTAVLLAVPETVDLFVQPISVDLGVPEARLGWLYAGFMLVSSAATYYTGELRERIGIGGWFKLAPVLVAVPLLAMVVAPAAAFPAFFVARASKSISYALRGQYLNDRLPSLGRATVLSTASLVYGVFIVIGRFVGGGLADALSPAGGLAVMAAAMLAIVAATYAVESPFSAPVADSPERSAAGSPDE